MAVNLLNPWAAVARLVVPTIKTAPDLALDVDYADADQAVLFRTS